MNKYQGDFSGWVFSIGKSLKNNLLYRQPITIIIFLLVICFPGNQMSISIYAKIFGCILFLLFYLSIVVYPLIRNAKVLSNIITCIKIDGDNYLISYKSIFSEGNNVDSYLSNQINIGEKEIYHEKIFRAEKFMVLDANGKKIYLFGDLLAENESLFYKNNK